MLVYSDLEAGARDPTRVAESPKAIHRLETISTPPYVELTIQLSIPLNTTSTYVTISRSGAPYSK